jgi:acyl-CoA synthetase (AMP-forming)/AMP-acid ligase II
MAALFPSPAYQDIAEEEVLGVRMTVYQKRPRNLPDMLQQSVTQYGERDCLVQDQVRWTFADFARYVDSAARELQRRWHISSGERVAILLTNRLEFAVAYYAAVTTGAIAVVLNARCKARELEFMLRDSEPRVLITEPALYEEVAAVLESVSTLEAVVLCDGGDALPSRALSFDTLVQAQGKPFQVAIAEDDVAALLYTSGTTGRPKGAMQTHRNLVSNAMNATSLFQFAPGDRTLIVAPFYHATGSNSQLTAMLYAGGTSIVRPAFKADDFMEWIERESVTVGIGVATMFWLMLHSPNFGRYDLSSLRYIVYGGSPAPVELLRQLRRTFPRVQLGNVWGLTECTSIATLLPDSETLRIPESVGLPAPVLQVRVVDAAGQGVPDGESGELIVKGPSVVRGYWRRPEATAGTFKDGWLYTGDLGLKDADGFFYVLDRKKDMIIRGGQNIYCIEVENVLYQHPAVLEAAVVGVPDEVFGEQVKAVLAAKPGMALDGEEVRDFCRRAIADYKVPKYVEIVPALPRNPGGKVIKTQLRQVPTGSHQA